ncbi:BstXI family restriction endonuclease [Arthrobacter citreus]|uniref:BstXI family restriction endonuclease n=1 Tax=Arthrobacter citreus TaxID=1670 RepID=UPI00380561F7
MSNGGNKLPALPPLVQEKLQKSGYTRGATVREIYQNRVTRSNPVLIPWDLWQLCKIPGDGTEEYERGFIVLVEPSWYFTTGDADAQLGAEGLELGVNALLLYRRRFDWEKFQPKDGALPGGKPFSPASARTNPLGGTYFSRIHATTSDGVRAVSEGFNTNKLRGAGIRVYEYASSKTIDDSKLQLECLIWNCHDSIPALVSAGMSQADASKRKTEQKAAASARDLWDVKRLTEARILNDRAHTICPLCLEELSAADFFKRSEQAKGRETYDLTVTEISLFHIQELRVGKLQHKPYNLGWGHHFCNVVVKDAGIIPTLEWMKRVVDNNGDSWEKIQADKILVEEAVDL